MATSAAAAAGVQIQTITKGLPALKSKGKRGSNLKSGAVKGASSAGLRLNNDRLALKSAFYNGGSAIAVPETEGAAGGGGGGRINMRVAAKGAYICRDCGYIYNERRPFEKLPDDFSCPVCAAPKRRFKPYEAPVARNANDQAVRKARKAELKQADVGLGTALPIGIAVGVAALIGVYIYVNGI
ncbi:unnamed protein product [Calypogeia fissa]